MKTKIHTTAIIAKEAEIEENCFIGPYCIIGKNVKLGKGSKLFSNVTIDGFTFVGEVK